MRTNGSAFMGISSETGHFYLFISPCFMGRHAVTPVWHRPQLTDLQSEPQPLILVLKLHLKLLTQDQIQALPSTHSLHKCLTAFMRRFCPVVLIEDLKAFSHQKEIKHFRRRGAAAASLKINNGEVNGKTNTSDWQLDDPGSTQHDTIPKLSFLPLWPSHLPLALTLLPSSFTWLRHSSSSKNESSDLTSWTLLPQTLTLSALLLWGAKQLLPPDWNVTC